MRAVELVAFGGPDRLRCASRDVPRPGEGQAVVRVRACGVCFQDTLMRAGRAAAASLPRVPGHEFAGDVVAVGHGTRGIAVGDRVAAVPKITCGGCAPCRSGRRSLCAQPLGWFGVNLDGGYAEYVAADERALRPVPCGVAFEAAAIAACAIGPAYNGLMTKSRVTSGETVVVTGASGGLGSHAIQVARLAGARVIGVTGTAEKVPAVTAAGAEEVVVSGDGDFAAAVRAMTGGRGAEVVVENVGATTLVASLKSLRPGGRLVLLGDVSGTAALVSPAVLILKELSLVVGKYASPDELDDILSLLATGQLVPQVSATIALEEAAAAHARLEARQALGRCVLVP
jgi:acryloyl-coenzyme A reductase